MLRRNAVTRLFDGALALLASLFLCLLPGTYATAGQIELSDILDFDPLGYSCVPSRYLDETDDGGPAIAFSLSGKTRLPRTCLPDPCARALTRTELSQLTGTSPMLARFSEEWDDYYARYADHCVREITVSRPRTDFWKPIISRAEVTQRAGLPTSSRRVPYIPLITVPEQPTIPTSISFDPISGLPDGALAGPSPIPIPASGLMFAVVLGAGGMMARKRRRNTAASTNC